LISPLWLKNPPPKPGKDNYKSSRLAKSFAKILAFNLLAALYAPTAFGAIFNVDIEPLAFNPDPVDINVNDQVVWTWVSDLHNTVSDTPGLWDSGIFDTGHVFTNTFNNSGTFTYSCTVHGFGGTIIVHGSTAPSASRLRPMAPLLPPGSRSHYRYCGETPAARLQAMSL
jgi:plastocyanin